MAKYLISTVETYRVDSEAEAEQLVNEAKEDTAYELLKYTCENKSRKAKGEIIDNWVRCTLTKGFADEKEPEATVTINYEI